MSDNSFTYRNMDGMNSRIVLCGSWKNWIIHQGKLIFFDWLKEQDGPITATLHPQQRWAILVTNPICVYFRNERDAMLFKLTWL